MANKKPLLDGPKTFPSTREGIESAMNAVGVGDFHPEEIKRWAKEDAFRDSRHRLEKIGGYDNPKRVPQGKK